MKKLLKWLSVPVILLVIYMAGPKPPTPVLNGNLPRIDNNLLALENTINQEEAATEGIKKDNQARIVWYDSTSREKTPYSIVYLHGFSASQGEGSPVHRNLAHKFGCNLYLSRLADHGIEEDSIFKELTPESLLASAKKAVAIGKQLGDSVIVVGTSTGGALGIYLAAENPEIKALVCYSPIIDFYDQNTFIINKPWGRSIMRMIVGSDFLGSEKSPLEEQYWSTKYMIDGVITLKSFISECMVAKTFKKVTCPFFLGYYYKNDTLQDDVVSIPAMLDMYDQLGTPKAQKVKVPFPESGDHVIASYITSNDYKGVERETIRFMKDIVGLPLPKVNLQNPDTITHQQDLIHKKSNP
ncbi:alpha/beta hydrolase [Fulvivirgaceae bacterium BMA12]|uniref:Alpha/beta hydrolase n=1 Tax=Agaribacillus aureus TaxID=3051825 RepID=A0ABT8LCU1_9BACT|nr:alpha/beta hydrolase [Fulvivirgaceae bacterium BMA12]